MDFNERAKEIRDALPWVTFTQARVAAYHCDPCGWDWVDARDGEIFLSCETMIDYTETFAIDKDGVVRKA